MNFKVGCVPLNWNQFRSAAPQDWPEERVLREVKEAGYEGVSWGARKGHTPAQTLEYLAGFGLVPAPGYMGGDWWKLDARDSSVEQAKRMAEVSAQLGVTEIFVSANGFGDYTSRRNGKNRGQLAGQVQSADGLTPDEWQIMGETLNAIGDAMLESEVRACYHNHVGAVVETRAEMEQLLALTDRERLFLGPDTGHLAWGGADVTAFFRDYAPHIKAVHLKDASEAVRLEGIEKAWDYGQFSAAGIWRELGEGDIDFASVFAILREENFAGWVLSETDVTQKSSPLESSQISRDYLKTLGV